MPKKGRRMVEHPNKVTSKLNKKKTIIIITLVIIAIFAGLCFAKTDVIDSKTRYNKANTCTRKLGKKYF